MIDFAKTLALDTGKLLMSYFGKQNKITWKGEIDPVTEADLAAEELIITRIKTTFPDHGIISEESDNYNTDVEYVWVIDPIDGTTGFSHSHPFFCVSIALRKNNKTILGVVNAPYLHELFYAQLNKGAYLNDKKIHVSKIDTLKRSLVATGFPYARVYSNNDNLKYFNQVAKVAGGLRRCGAAALDLCYVACGRYECYWEFALKDMDSAAGRLIVEEAGGIITDLQGHPIHEKKDTIVASNKMVHDQLLKILGDVT